MKRLLLILLASLTACSSLPEQEWRYAQSTQWILTEIGGKPALEDIQVSLRLEAEDRVFGDAGVNSYFGSFARNDDEIVFGRLASTRKAGPPFAMEQELLFLETLVVVEEMRVEPEVLTLLRHGKPVLRFRPKR